jgi:zinc transporter ZupT
MTTLKKFMTLLGLVALARADATLTTSECWGYGFLTGFCLSMLGFVAALLLICIQRCLTEGCFKIFVNLLYALACGAIIGDAMIHILPEAFKSEYTNSRYVSLIFICAIAFFIILERLFKSCGISHEHWGEESHHDHQKTVKDEVSQPPAVQASKKEV